MEQTTERNFGELINMVRVIDLTEDNSEDNAQIANNASLVASTARTIRGIAPAQPITHTGGSGGSPVFDVRDYGWESISTPVKEQNVIKALRGANLNWSVLPRPITVDGEIVKGRFANVRSDLPPGQNVLEIVGSKYKIVQNRDALEFVQDVIGTGEVVLERAGTFNGGKTVFLQGSTQGLTVGGDKIAPYVIFSNSHDGTSCVQVALTAIRVVCKNTLALALKTAPRIWSVQHTKSAESRMKAARNAGNFIGNYLTELPAFIERLQDTPVNGTQFATIAERLFPIPAATPTNRTAVSNAASQRAIFDIVYNETKDLKQFKETAWGVYNAYTDMISHSTPMRASERFAENRFARNLGGRDHERAQGIIAQVVGGIDY